MALPLSKSQIELLGVRLVTGTDPAPADTNLLHILLEAYGGVLEGAVARVRAPLEVSPTSRIKSTGTILEKLRRQGGSWLKSTQDIAGMRIIGGSDRREQDALVGHLFELFENEGRAPKIVDRRMHPSHGYRAVHVIVFPDAVPVEIQTSSRQSKPRSKSLLRRRSSPCIAGRSPMDWRTFEGTSTRSCSRRRTKVPAASPAKVYHRDRDPLSPRL